MSGYMCKASWCARIPENEGEEFCRVCLATRAEAKAEGAAEAYTHAASYVRSIVRTTWSAPLLEHFDALARGSAPAPADDAQTKEET